MSKPTLLERILEQAAFNRQMQKLNDDWYAAGKYEKWGCDAFGNSFVLADSEEDDRAFECMVEWAQYYGKDEFTGSIRA